MAVCCVDIMVARSLSSRDMRFSAVKFPCDSGEGRVGRGAGDGLEEEEEEPDVVAVEVAMVGKEGVIPGARVEVAVAVDDAEEEEVLR